MPQLAERFTVAWINPRGTGRSDRPFDGNYRFASFVRDFDAVRNHLQWDSCWVAGHSMGGFLAQLYAATYTRRCSGLIVICTYAAMDEQYQTGRQARIAQRSQELWFQDVAAAFARNPSTDEDMAENFKKRLPMYFANQAVLGQRRKRFEHVSFSIDAFKGAFGSNPSHEIVTQLAHVDVRSIILAADRDFICSPSLGQRIHMALPGSKFVLVENCGHFPWIEQPEQFWRSVDVTLAACGVK
jgi:proline iminopeptidase